MQIYLIICQKTNPHKGQDLLPIDNANLNTNSLFFYNTAKIPSFCCGNMEKENSCMDLSRIVKGFEAILTKLNPILLN